MSVTPAQEERQELSVTAGHGSHLTSYSSMKPCSFKTIPSDVVQDIWVNWLSLLDVARADTALCAHSQRSDFLQIVHSLRCIYSFKYDYDYEDGKAGRLFSTHDFLLWVHLRGVCLSTLVLHFVRTDFIAAAVAIVKRSGIKLRRIHLGGADVQLSAVIAECCPALELFRYGYHADIEVIHPILGCASVLQDLTLDSKVNAATIAAIGKCGSCLRSLSMWPMEGLTIDWQQLLAALPHLVDIALAGPHVTDKDLITIAQYRPQLRSLRLAGTDVSDTSLRAVAENCRQLRRWKICQLVRAETMLALLANCRSLTSVWLPNCVTAANDILDALAQNLPGLRELVVPALSKADQSHIAKLLPCWPHLDHLDLQCSSFDGALFTAVATNCLQVRFLSFNFYDEAAVTDSAVAAVAKGCPELRQLWICADGMTTEDAALLTNAGMYAILAHCRYIQLVELLSPGWVDTGSWSNKVQVLPAFRKFLVIEE